ncbi:Transglutaminase-like enzyme, putative cysteine protease [Propionibacterium cyclohexanicum]|uniref:Transglutaminase-like enzyme, putative cysteine protease n=1 Tax=Propionibacterium cyclohexanicum TaxID=64702 RepID=A0A1H9SC14_9ACTN|nr:transglutaminase family protein [Propionibacterium cyclohexanicum]SER81913.1 Transglutaminase-like enzyme, putative cysteine protease [Propionibacterium cyclohexanicum]
MTTTLRIVHTTGYRYSEPVSDSFNEIRMQPRYTPEQLIRERSVLISPTPWSYSSIDYWGTQVTSFELHEPHDVMTIRVETSLDVTRRPPVSSSLRREDLESVRDRWNEYLTITPLVDPGPELASKAEEIAAHAVTVDECGRGVAELVNRSLHYASGTTTVNTTAAEAWATHKGVCQDYAHLTIGALRHLAIPCRYVSGYVMGSEDAPIGTEVVGESHAWVEWWNGAWVGFDPTNDTVPTESHVQVGVGRDYRDVPPLKGMFRGRASSQMFVEVRMTRLA